MTKQTAAQKITAIFPEIAAIKAEREDLNAVQPIDGTPEKVEWVAKSRALSAKANEAWKVTKGIVCQKCGGHGRYEHHVYVNRCERCGGDGWTAKGRKLYAS